MGGGCGTVVAGETLCAGTGDCRDMPVGSSLRMTWLAVSAK